MLLLCSNVRMFASRLPSICLRLKVHSGVLQHCIGNRSGTLVALPTTFFCVEDVIFFVGIFVRFVIKRLYTAQH